MVEMCLPRWTYALEEITGAKKDSFGGQHLELATLAEELGKTTGVDAGKNTFVQLYGLDVCDQLVKDHTVKALAELELFERNEFMRLLSAELVDRTA